MQRIAIRSIPLLLLFLFTLFTAPARAGGVIECNNCPSTRNAAISSGAGLTVVVDFDRALLTAYEVEYDRELRRWRALPVAVPPQISAAFYRALDASSLGRPAALPAREDGKPEKLLDEKNQPRKGDGGLIVPMHPDNPQYSNPLGVSFPAAYMDANAHQIVQGATYRNRLGQQLALDLAGASTNSAAWNVIALSVQKLVLTVGDRFGAGAITILITWRDGSQTVYRITKENVADAKYVQGESRDNMGNKIPDEAITQPQTAAGYVGHYYFGELHKGGSQNLNQWMHTANMYGIPVTGSAYGRNRMSCTWDGKTVRCRVI